MLDERNGYYSYLTVCRLEEFLRRRARLQRVEEAVRRKTVIGFFDMLYWSSRFRKAKKARQFGNMTTVPQFNVPEILVDGSDSPDRSESNSIVPSPIPSAPSSIFSYDGVMSSGNDAVAATPPASPRRRTNPTQIASAATTAAPAAHGRAKSENPRTSLRPVSDLFSGELRLSRTLSQPSIYDSDLLMAAEDGYEFEDGSGSAAGRSRAGSAVEAQNVLNVLESSAWGESIRRSFSTRRPSRRRPAH